MQELKTGHSSKSPVFGANVKAEHQMITPSRYVGLFKDAKVDLLLTLICIRLRQANLCNVS